jgi:hypothetical protein
MVTIRSDLAVIDSKNVRLIVGTPLYGGMANRLFVRSMCELTFFCERHAIALDTCFVLN